MKPTPPAPFRQPKKLKLKKGDKVVNAQRHLFEEVISIKSNQYYGLEAEVVAVDKKCGKVAVFYPSLATHTTQNISDFELVK